MSTNYNILLRSEKQLKKLVLEYLDLVYKIHTKAWAELNASAPADYGVVFDNVERRLKRALLQEEELIDECIWTISKDDPRANHLRFIVSIIYCTKDLTRACEYAQSILKIIIRRNLDAAALDPLRPIVKTYLELLAKIIKVYSSAQEDKLERVDELITSFETTLTAQEAEVKARFGDDPQVLSLYISQIIRLINSTIERTKSVFPSTLFIKASASSGADTKKKK